MHTGLHVYKSKCKLKFLMGIEEQLCLLIVNTQASQTAGGKKFATSRQVKALISRNTQRIYVNNTSRIVRLVFPVR